jgi:hypothetical protein
MARRKSTREVHSPRNRGALDDSCRSPDTGSADAAGRTDQSVALRADAAIEAARTKLMRARAVLDCTRFVLLYDDQLAEDPQRPSFSDAVDVAREFVGEVIEALDRVNLRFTKTKPHRKRSHSDSE